MADHFLDDEIEEFLRKVRIELCSIGKFAQPRDLLDFTGRIGGRQTMGGLQLADRLGALESLCEQVDESGVDVVDAVPQSLQFRINGHAGRVLRCQTFPYGLDGPAATVAGLTGVTQAEIIAGNENSEDEMENLFSLKGRVALVTGGSRGIGRMIAEGFLHSGAKVYISARKAAQCEETAQALSALGPCVALPLNASGADGAKEMARAYLSREKKIDILVNNAGAAWGADFDEFPESGWDKVMDLNLKTPFFLTQALHGALKAAATPDRPAKVINIASIDGIAVNPQETYSYHASKAGLIHLTKRMAMRLIRDNIVVSAIAPGAFASDMNRDARDHGDALARRIPSQRIGTPEDMAGAAIFLASRAGDYVVGSTIIVDGGVSHERV